MLWLRPRALFFPSCSSLYMCRACVDTPRCYSLMHLRNRITYPTTGFRWKLPTKRVYRVRGIKLSTKCVWCMVELFWYVRSSLWHFLRPQRNIQLHYAWEFVTEAIHLHMMAKVRFTHCHRHMQHIICSCIWCVLTVATAENALLFKSICIYARVLVHMGNGSDCVRHVVDVNGLKSTTIIRKLVEYYNKRAWYGRLYASIVYMYWYLSEDIK